MATAVALVGFCFLLRWVGYPVAALVFATLLLRWLGAGWRSAVVTGIASAAVSYYLFGVLLNVPLPPASSSTEAPRSWVRWKASPTGSRSR